MNRYPNLISCEDCCESLSTECADCGAYGTYPNPTIDLRYLRDCIAALGVEAELYQSGGGCATIGIGATITYPDDWGSDFAYFVGVGYYHDGTASRDELGAGSAEHFHTPTPNAPNGNPQLPHDNYAVCMGDEETVEALAARIVTAHAQLTAAHRIS